VRGSRDEFYPKNGSALENGDEGAGIHATNREKQGKEAETKKERNLYVENKKHERADMGKGSGKEPRNGKP